MRYFIYLSYIGKAYSGWQIQRNAPSLQQVIQEVLCSLLREPIAIVGSSRTDKGVHAKQQVAHFDVSKTIEPMALTYKLNRVLPADISVIAIWPVVPWAHARFDAYYRIYEYSIVTQKDPFYQATATWVHTLPPLELLNKAAALFCVKADFERFSKATYPIKNFVCTIEACYWSQIGNITVLRIKANRFLHGMVRSIVGAMLQVGRGKIALDMLKKSIGEKASLRPVWAFAPAHGLALVEVGYPEQLFL